MTRDRVCVFLVNVLPKRIVYWCAMRVFMAAKYSVNTFKAFNPKNEVEHALKEMEKVIAWYRTSF